MDGEEDFSNNITDDDEDGDDSVGQYHDWFSLKLCRLKIIIDGCGQRTKCTGPVHFWSIRAVFRNRRRSRCPKQDRRQRNGAPTATQINSNPAKGPPQRHLHHHHLRPTATTTTEGNTDRTTTTDTSTEKQSETPQAHTDDEPVPVAPTDSADAPRPSEKRKSTCNSRKRTHRIAKAKEELLRAQVQLAAARLAALETEETDSEEDENTVVQDQETQKRVGNWVDTQMETLATIDAPHQKNGTTGQKQQNTDELATAAKIDTPPAVCATSTRPASETEQKKQTEIPTAVHATETSPTQHSRPEHIAPLQSTGNMITELATAHARRAASVRTTYQRFMAHIKNGSYGSTSAEQPQEEPDLIKMARFLEREAERCSAYAPPETITQPRGTITQMKRIQKTFLHRRIEERTQNRTDRRVRAPYVKNET
ncbi:hypothetical protein EVAR_99669_1 [Eumeta japonica]|uniref:Uncharacterized protein n=1 Tax=Eumeta variegata TaxID=151549 RepID=A0A4C2A253_EUMVA|nr:hypothetical protein EVAR_99669_1 [Eumeta japonica]